MHIVNFGTDTPPAKLTAKHNGRVENCLAIFPTLADHTAFLDELQDRVNTLCARKGIPAFNIRVSA